MVEGEESASHGVWIVVRLVRAQLRRSFATFPSISRMNVYATAEWRSEDGEIREIARTPVKLGAHLRPEWNHTSREQPYCGRGGQESIRIQVWHERCSGFISPTLCGEASASMGWLLGDADTPMGSCKHQAARNVELGLMRDNEEVGSILVQALLVRTPARDDFGLLPAKSPVAPNAERKLVRSFSASCIGPPPVSDAWSPASAVSSATRVDPAAFEAVEPLCMTSGTARFYRLQLDRGSAMAAGKPPDHFLGKDLAHAAGEVRFYESVARISRERCGGGLAKLLPFMLGYAGVLECRPSRHRGREQEIVMLLVMQNLGEGCKALRLLDIKVGQQTAAPGWQGKSRMRAYKQSILDGFTNSVEEGFRLEGFSTPPAALASMDPMLDLSIPGLVGTPWQKRRALRLMLQRMSAQEMLRHFFDLRDTSGQGQHATKLAASWGTSETMEVTHHEVVARLAHLALACRLTLVPQKWVGSSIALAFDVGALPPRSESEASVRSRVRVKLLDWGRSELNTLDSHMELSDAQQRDRALYWGYYVEGLDRLLWSVMRAYHHRFGSDCAWREVIATVYDYDSITLNDFIGCVVIPLQKTEETTVELLGSSGTPVSVGRCASTLTYAVDYQTYPWRSRLHGVWSVRLIRATNLPPCDYMKGKATSDPFVVLQARSEDGRRFRQQTNVLTACLDPEWQETLEVPVIRRSFHLQEALVAAGLQVSDRAANALMEGGPLEELLPSESAPRHDQDKAFRLWRLRLNQAAETVYGVDCTEPDRPDVRTPWRSAAPARRRTSLMFKRMGKSSSCESLISGSPNAAISLPSAQ